LAGEVVSGNRAETMCGVFDSTVWRSGGLPPYGGGSRIREWDVLIKFTSLLGLPKEG
jgi:hypothetical protein|tara:strand:+ start:139 stop:309 length:171 start_codon:yes stop_codon:yes gene_type:complete